MLIYLDLQLYLATFKRDLAIEVTNSPIINSQARLLDFMQFPPYCEFMAVCAQIIYLGNQICRLVHKYI